MQTHVLGLTSLLLVWGTSGWSAGTHSAVEPVPRPDAAWQNRHKSFNQRVAEVGDRAQVIFMGDSITQGWEGEGKEVWAHYYAHRNAVNLGIGGDRTQHVLWRLNNGNLNGIRPKAAVVMIGTNNSNGDDNSVDQIADGVRAIVGALRQQLPQTQVLLLAIFPRSENPNAQRGKILMVNQVIRRLADEPQVFWIDLGHQLVNDNGLIPRDLMPDYLHLSRRGYALWAEAIEDTLSRILGDERVKPLAAGAGGAAAPLTGEWTWTMESPSGPVAARLILKQEGRAVTGRFARDATRWLEIEKGQVDGDAFTWIVKRDRPDGSLMTYQMSGKFTGTQITGRAKTTMDGQEVVVDWSAKRN
jgi:beta-glucosidase